MTIDPQIHRRGNWGLEIHDIMPLGKVDHSKQRLQKIGTLHSEDDLADITIHVEGQRFPSHRVILSAQSSFFKELLYDGRWERDITLHDISALIFSDLLQYLYTGQLSLENTMDNYAVKIVHQAKRFDLQLLHRDVVDDMCAYLLSEEPLTDNLGDFLDNEADAVIKTDMFVALPQIRVQELLSRDSFWVNDEIDIFNAVMRWSEGKTEDERKAVLSTVRLSLIQPKDLLRTVRLAGTIPEKDILNAMDRQMHDKKDAGEQRRPKVDAATMASVVMPAEREPVVTVADKNIATMARGASVIAGDNPVLQCILLGEHKYSNYTGYLNHRIQKQGVKKEGIQVQLDKVYNINTVQLHLQDRNSGLVSYYIEVSRQRDGPWTRVIDYTRYKCRGRQLLYFNTTPARYVKVVGAASTIGDTFALVSLACSYTETPLPMTQGLLEPVENQALEATGALLMQGENERDGKSMLVGIHTDKNECSWCCKGDTIQVALPQPVSVGSLRFRLYEEARACFRYTIDVSVNDETWARVADKSQEDCTSWQSIAFDQRPVSFIKFTCIASSIFASQFCDQLFVRHLECPEKDTL